MKPRDGTIELTPSQGDFCEKHIKNFNRDRRHVSMAGTAGSDRRFLRISPADGKGASYILVIWDSRDADWDRFIAINKEVTRAFPVVPQIYAADEIHGLILEEDCGRQTLKMFCSDTDDSGKIEKMYREVLAVLIQWQSIDIHRCPEIASRKLDKEVFLWETGYFTAHCVSEYFGLDGMLTPEWNRERIKLAQAASELPLACLHRDFQSENIMIQNGKIRLVDYQGARLGAAEYDVVSLLFDPYVTVLNDTLRHRLFDFYIKRSERESTRQTLHIAALQRLCQALGAYGNLSLHKGKEYYKQYIPSALRNLLKLLENESGYPLLKQIVQECYRRVEKPEK